MLFRSWEATASSQSWPDVAVVRDHVGHEHVLVTRHRLVRQVLADAHTFRPDNALDAMTPLPVGALRILTRYGFRLPPTLANNAGSSHPAIRAVVAQALHPDRVAAQRPWLTGLIDERVTALRSRLASGDSVDLYAELTADLPLQVLARLIDLPPTQTAMVTRFARAALELFWAPLDPGRQHVLAETVGRFHVMLRAVAAEGGGLAAALRAVTDDPDVVVGALFFLLVAGQETTSQFLTLLLHRLAGEPAVRTGLATGAVSVEDVVEEGLRLDAPIVTWRRTTGCDTTLGGVRIAAGSSVVMWLARAGRDVTVVPAPEQFQPGQRGSRRHLAFGAGAHRCVGAQLTRMEAAVLVSAAVSLLDDVAVVRPPWCPDNLSFRMPDAFVIRRRTADVPRR